MTGQHRKPSPERQPFLVRPVDADAVRKAIAGVAADAINRAAETVRKIREWCDQTEDDAVNVPCGHPDGCDCGVMAATTLALVEEVRSLLPPVPEAAEEVDMDGTRVTRDDREYPGDDNHWRVTGGGENEGVDSGN